ncbi:hypothetical protein BJX76DRAFT_346839 [Aspergillus varians]
MDKAIRSTPQTSGIDRYRKGAWADLREAAKERVRAYQPGERPNEGKLGVTLEAFLDWLPLKRENNLLRGTLQQLGKMMRSRCTGHPIMSNVEIAAGALTDPQTHDDRFRDDYQRWDGGRCVVCQSMTDRHPHPFLEDVLYLFFPDVQRIGMRVETVNDLRNGLTLDRNLHFAFGQFDIAFSTPDQHTVKAYPGYPSTVSDQFPKDSVIRPQKAREVEDLHLPDSTTLDCHYRLAEIMQASGMGEYIERRSRVWGNYRGAAGPGHLSKDGSTDVETLFKLGLW